jgi:uncharacterized RDD family membrane protein YckC
VDPHPAATTPGEAQLASPWLRLVGGLIDYVILLAATAVISAVFTGSLNQLRGVVLLVAIGYLTYFWAARGQTIGMMVFGIRVRDQKTGARPTGKQALTRAGCWLGELVLSVVVVGLIAGLWMFWDPRSQALHDKAAGTIVTKS